jgi:hypothetical protein
MHHKLEKKERKIGLHYCYLKVFFSHEAIISIIQSKKWKFKNLFYNCNSNVLRKPSLWNPSYFNMKSTYNLIQRNGNNSATNILSK